MKLTIQLDDWQLDEIKDALRVTPEHFDAIVENSMVKEDPALPYAYRILRARKAMDLSVRKEHATQ